MDIFAFALLFTIVRTPVEYNCRGLDAYDIRGQLDVDTGVGSIAAKNGKASMAFSLGMVKEFVPAERPPGFRSVHVENIGDVVLRYGFDVRKKLFEATLVGAPMSHFVNLAGRDREELLTMARALAAAPCAVVEARSRREHESLLQETDPVAAALHWPALRDEEVRVWVGFGLTYPMAAVRVRHDSRWRAEAVRWWPKDLPKGEEREPFVARMERGCTDIHRGDVVVCRRVLGAAEAERIAHRLEQMGVWTVASPSEPTREQAWTIMLDGTSALVERRRNGHDAQFSFAVDAPNAWNYDPAAKRIADFVETLADFK